MRGSLVGVLKPDTSSLDSETGECGNRRASSRVKPSVVASFDGKLSARGRSAYAAVDSPASVDCDFALLYVEVGSRGTDD